LAEREFRLLFTGQMVSLLGSAVAPIALAFGVLELTGSKTDLGLVLAAGMVPQVLLILFGGVFADRLPRNLVMVGSNVVSAAAQGGIAVLLLTHRAQLWHLIALQVIRGVALSFFFPASQGLVPETVRPGLLQQANALLGMTKNGTNILGAALGGAFVALAGAGWALAFDAGTYAASAAVLAAMRLPRAQKVDAPNMLRELREGWSEFASRTWLWTIVAAFSLSNMVWTGAFLVLGPIVAKEFLGGAAAWGVIVAAEGAGLLAGGLLLLRFRPQRPLFVGMGAFSFASLPLVLLASVRSTLVIALGFVVAGIASEIFSIAWSTALQQHVPLDKLSRVSAYDGLGSIVLIPLGLAIVGPVADAIGLKEALWLAAAISTLSALSTLAVRDVRELRQRDDVPAEPMLEAVP
jgi:predicted MFS family arabinose efflux permease